jgi:hypothetical protein
MFAPTKVLFLKLVRIPALFLILLRIFLKLERRFSSSPCLFYSKVMADGTSEKRDGYGIVNLFVGIEIIAELERGKTLQSGERLGLFSSEPTSFTPVISLQA